ncbi:MAG: alginate lyase family protein [Candidatus Acidiferrales bacterium]
MSESGRNFRKRLKQASWAEVSTRGRQSTAKYWDYAVYRLGIGFKEQRLPTSSAHRGRFFFSSEEVPTICARLRERLPGRVQEIQDSAERICAHRFDLLGYEGLDYGPRIDWHADLVHSKRAPLKPWFRVRYLDFNEVGDSKITWELNRHQHLVTLAKAYLLTKDTRYTEELFRLWYDWRQQNPYPIGINWASSLEVAFRSLSWIWIYHLLQGTPVLPQTFQSDLTSGLALHGRHIEKYLSTYFSPNTHLLGEGVALFFLGTLFPAIPNAHRWGTKGWQVIQQQAIAQVQDDGMYFEQSLHYHVYALDFFLHARTLATVNQMRVGAEFDATIVKMLEALCTLSQAGCLPHFGDDDGGRVFDPSRNRAEHLLDPLCTGAAIFMRSDFKAAGTLCEEALWLLGDEGIDRFDSLAETRPKVSSALPASGIYVLADHNAGQQLIFDAGPLGFGRAGHGHADALSVNLSIAGREFLTDPGTFSYVSADIDRNRLRGTGAHNTVRIDGFDQAEPDGPFGWRELPRVNLETYRSGDAFSLLVADHSGYQRLPGGVVHKREIFHLKSRFWFVRDVIRGSGEHELEQFWHFAPGLEVKTGADGSFTVQDSCKDHCLVLLSAENRNSQGSMEEDYWSPSYGNVTASSTLCLSRKIALPSEFVTILIPLPRSRTDNGRLTRLNLGKMDPNSSFYRYDAPGETHHFFFNDSGLEWRAGVWQSNARFFYCATLPTGSLLRWIVSRGSFLTMGDESLFHEGEMVELREWADNSAANGETLTPDNSPADLHGDAREPDKALLRTVGEEADTTRQR